MKVLLLGSTGYLGKNIANKLVEDGHYVICVVRSTSDCSGLDASNSAILLIKNSISQIETTIKEQNIDWVINAVCTYKPNDSLYGDMLESNVTFPLNVLNLAIKYNVKFYMTIGTGLPDDFNVYSFTKHEFAEFGRFFSKKNNINFLNLKLEMFYGGLYEPSSRFLKSCLNRLRETEPLNLTEGLQKRDVIRVEDVVGIIALLVKKKNITGYMELSVGTGESHSIKDIVVYMKEKCGSSSTLNFGAVKTRVGEPDTCANINWIDDLGYKMQYSFWDGLKYYCE